MGRSVRHALRQSWPDPRLTEAASRLARAEFRPEVMHVAMDPGLLILTSAMDPAERWSERLDAARSVPFPEDGDRAVQAALEALLSEQRGELRPDGPHAVRLHALATALGLETRALGTVAPGLNPSPDPEATTLSPGDESDLWRRWQAVAADGSDPAQLRTLDGDVRAAAEKAGVPIGSWPELMATLDAEHRGEGVAVRTPLSALKPSWPRYALAVARAVDHDVRAGRWGQARATVRRAVKAGCADAAVLRRYLRLTWDRSKTPDDDTALVLAAEAALRAGDSGPALNAFRAARPAPGSAAAHHAARRLIEAGQILKAQPLLTAASPAPLRLAVYVAMHRWEEASVAWAETQGAHLGLSPQPEWADPAVKATLSVPYQALLNGELEEAFREPALAPLRAQLESTAAASQHTSPDAAVALVYETPDPRVALRALADAIADSAQYAEFKGLALALAREVPHDEWDVRTADALDRLAERAAHPGRLLDALPDDILRAWLAGTDPDTRDVAVRLLDRVAEEQLSEELAEAVAHSPLRRLRVAKGLLADGRPSEAAQIAAAVLRKAATRRVRMACIRLMLAAEQFEQVAKSLEPERSAAYLDATLAAILELDDPSPELRRAATVLATSTAPQRIRRAAAAVVQK